MKQLSKVQNLFDSVRFNELLFPSFFLVKTARVPYQDTSKISFDLDADLEIFARLYFHVTADIVYYMHKELKLLQ